MLASSFPDSLPKTYPAEKLIAEKSTTTPALRTQVITAEDGSVLPDRRLFLAAEWLEPRSFEALDRRFARVEEVPRGEHCITGCWGRFERGAVRISTSDAEFSSLAPSPIATDSDTNRNEAG